MKRGFNRQRHQDTEERRRKIFVIVTAVIATVLLIGFVVLKILIDRSEVRLPSAVEYGSASIVDSDPGAIPDYSGEDHIVLNDNKPCFNSWDLAHITGEHYSELDRFGRCGVAYAMLDRSMMPDGERGDIGEIRPSGWVQKKYEGIVDCDPPYLYNRSHLIAYALTGQNANELNLITGTRYMNATTMLFWEEKVMEYIDGSFNHVLYRVTPYFKDDELLARGVEMEAYSVEDKGRSLCFHVFIYNVQPGIELDYSTGESRAV